MTVEITEPAVVNFENHTIIATNKSAKMLKHYFSNDMELIYGVVDELKAKPKVIFFNSPDSEEYLDIVIHGEKDWIVEISKNQILCFKSKTTHLCEINSRKKIIKNLIPIIIAILFTEWHFPSDEDREFQNYIINMFKTFLKNFSENNLQKNDYFEMEFFENLLDNLKQKQNEFVRVDILPHRLPIFKLRRKIIKLDKLLIETIKNDDSINQNLNNHGFLNNIQLDEKTESILLDNSISWVERRFTFKYFEISHLQHGIGLKDVLEFYKNKLDDEFTNTLKELELVDGYGNENESKLRTLVESIIDDKLANRTSNKLIIGPQGTGKSSFALLLGKLMDARVLTIECGPLTDNSDLFGAYEIIIDPETRQAVTVYNENGFMYASKLVNEGNKVILAIEEYNLLPSETLLKQLNRFFQDRIISSMGGRYELSIENKNDIVVIMTGNYDFNQDWLSDVGLIRRFEFFEFPLPSTESVIECLYNYVVHPEFNLRLSYTGAERIAEIRDDLVACLNEKTIRPLLSKEIKYPDLFTLRSFALDLLHKVKLETAVKRWLGKIILGGIPNDLELRSEYDNYLKLIQKTVEDRLPEDILEYIT